MGKKQKALKSKIQLNPKGLLRDLVKRRAEQEKALGYPGTPTKKKKK